MTPTVLPSRKLEAEPHGIDLGELEPRIPEVLRTPSGKIELAPDRSPPTSSVSDASLARSRNGGMVLIGRRQLRSNNSWMHNVPAPRPREGALHGPRPSRRRRAPRSRGRRPRPGQLSRAARSRLRSR